MKIVKVLNFSHMFSFGAPGAPEVAPRTERFLPDGWMDGRTDGRMDGWMDWYVVQLVNEVLGTQGNSMFGMVPDTPTGVRN